jgi:hypothetical protein
LIVGGAIVGISTFNCGEWPPSSSAHYIKQLKK